jgi:arabinose-5-phosphate isomerase
MSKNPKVMRDHYLASFALQTMENFKITTLIIVDNENKPVGIIHLHDLVNLGLRQR